jgi:hypothetical protein
MLLSLTAQAAPDPLELQLQALTQQVTDLKSSLAILEANLHVEDGKLQNQIDADRNSVFSLVLPYVVTLAMGLALFFFGNQSQNGKIKELTQHRVDQQLEKIIPETCDQKVWEYFKKKFPGDLSALQLAAKMIAYDVELRQTKRILLVGMDAQQSQPVIDRLRADGFKQVEFKQFAKGMACPHTDLLLIDRYYSKDSADMMDANDVEALIKSAKSANKGSDPSATVFVHYFGDRIPGLLVITDGSQAFSNMPNTLIPNIMDHLRFAYPKNYNLA